MCSLFKAVLLIINEISYTILTNKVSLDIVSSINIVL